MRIVAILLAALSVARDSVLSQEPAYPRAEDVPLQVAAGGIGALVASVVLMRFGRSAIGPRGGEAPGLEGTIYGFIAGVTLGGGAGVYLAARGRGLDVTYPTSVGGSLAGLLALVPLFRLSRLLKLYPERPAFWIAVYTLPVAGAVLMSNLEARAAVRRSGVQVGVAPAPGGGGARVSLRVAF